jgi:Tol biopolymer transport system component
LVDSDAIVLYVARSGGVLRAPEEIYVIATDGSGPLSATIPPKTYDLAWSPDGQWIATIPEDESAIYLLRSDGSHRIRVTYHTVKNASVVWSPDGTRLAYLGTNLETDEKGIYIQEVACITNSMSDCDLEPVLFAKDGYEPQWSANGKYIVYSHPWMHVRAKTLVAPVNAPQQFVELLPDHFCDHPHWLPNGDRIVLDCPVDIEDSRKGRAIYTVNADGSELTRLTDPQEGDAWYPQWSPDGRKITFISDRDDLGECISWFCGSGGIFSSALYVMDVDGSNIIRLSLRDDEAVRWYTWVP